MTLVLITLLPKSRQVLILNFPVYNEDDSILFGTRVISKLSSTAEISNTMVTHIATNFRDQITPEILSRILHVGLLKAKRTLKAPTNKFFCTACHKLK